MRYALIGVAIGIVAAVIVDLYCRAAGIPLPGGPIDLMLDWNWSLKAGIGR